ncbi:hypothetical protein [Rummeliibacillus stabekisii]|uniref:hypothetical protein n=1 Tax=Rummeliibacillus stabekisii TaxID=241244 RepID=UPI00116EB4B5|nr:hypothetical protein [Rummeliibacillus stabekisii]MBB5170985.1 hypothetical protein [Rummeliibacillus stabekisii]GEL05361.1 hypothetical protein RST01_19880 [Rummeliibacillus stabekisii]
MAFFKEEVYATYSLEDLAKVRGALATGGIKYTYKIKDLPSGWFGLGSSRGSFGNFGIDSKYQTQYAIFVNKKMWKKPNMSFTKHYIHRVHPH